MIQQSPFFNRRNFLKNSLGASAAFILPPLEVNKIANTTPAAALTVQQIMDIILKEVPGAPFKETVDTFKSGSGDQQVTGIVTTMFPTIDIIQKTAGLGANFIIAHEPSFYNHTDDRNYVKENSVLQKKLELLHQHGIAVWRFHDYWHSVKPDGIQQGVLRKTGWLQYAKEDAVNFKIPRQSLKEIVSHLKSSLGISEVRVIGDPSQSCSAVSLLPGAWGGERQIETAEKHQPDVLICGEVHEWETAEYVRDRRSFGLSTALIILGHAQSEEPGMEYLVDWLGPKIPGIKITHLESGNPFRFM